MKRQIAVLACCVGAMTACGSNSGKEYSSEHPPINQELGYAFSSQTPEAQEAFARTLGDIASTLSPTDPRVMNSPRWFDLAGLNMDMNKDNARRQTCKSDTQTLRWAQSMGIGQHCLELAGQRQSFIVQLTKFQIDGVIGNDEFLRRLPEEFTISS